MAFSYEDLRAALQEMKRARSAINMQADTIADLFLESMEDASPYTLQKIKKKLKRFDALRAHWNA